MQLTVSVKLRPNPFQAEALRHTMRRVNEACNEISRRAFEVQEFRRYSIHHLVYHDVREQFELGADATCLAIGKVADAYKLSHKTQRSFRSNGAVPYRHHVLSWKQDGISLWTIGGRMIIPWVAAERDQKLLAQKPRAAKLLYIDGQFYLHFSCKVETPSARKTDNWLGVDLGIVNIATDSDGTRHSGAKLLGLRIRHTRLRGRLQKKGTKSAKRRLKKRRHKEARFSRDTNHCISKRLVEKADGTTCGIALENLSGIRKRIRASRSGRRVLHAWSFFQLRAFIEYKAKLKGMPIKLVDPRNTSRECAECGYVDKRNRKTRDQFVCQSCAHSSCADWNAARVIARRAGIPRPYAERAVAR